MPPDKGALETPPLGLYVHLPWCVRKCPYCDFNSHQVSDDIPAVEYSAALIEDLEQDLPMVWGRPVSSVYFGGGTPSLFTAGQIDHLVSSFRARLDIVPGAEITLEANPGTVERDSFSAYRDAGITRVSLGAQTFNNDHLHNIGRIHDSSDIDTALASLSAAGLDNFNLDLMFGLPGQDESDGLQDIERAIVSGATHISHYQLTLEPNTAFAANPPKLPGDDACWDLQIAAAGLLSQHGYQQYEISAWSMDGRACNHNLNYWRYGDFLGIGAGAHAKVTDAGQGEIRRLSKSRHPRQYLAGERMAGDSLIGDQDRIFEFFLNHLRLKEGFSRDRFTARTGLAWSMVAEIVENATENELLEEMDGRWKHTERGWRFVNDIQAMFLPAN